MKLSTAQILELYKKTLKSRTNPHALVGTRDADIERNCALYKDLKLFRRSIVYLVSKYRISSARIYQIVELIEKSAESDTSEGSRTRRKSGATPHASSGQERGKEPTG